MSNDTKTMLSQGNRNGKGKGKGLTSTLQHLMARLGLHSPRPVPPPLGEAGDLQFSPKEGRYTQPREVGRGGMGTIYSVFDTDLERTTAMKVALPLVVRNPENAAHFVEEAKITARLEHPHIVPVHDLGWDEDIGLFYTMKMIRGVPLDELLAQIQLEEQDDGKAYDLFQLLTLFRKASDAIEFAHSQHIVHLDIKPENIMIGAYGEVQVMDWGIAQETAWTEAEKKEGGSDKLRALNNRFQARREVRGTPAYMAPEQATATASMIDEQTDVFLLGSTLYHILTLTPPYRQENTDELLKAAERGLITPPDQRNPTRQIPEELSAICMKALALRKSVRYRSVRELSQAIDQFMSGAVFARTRTFNDGEVLMHAGDAGDEAYLIVSGKADVYREDGEGRTPLQQLGTGDIVGEMALITSQPRSATVIAHGSLQTQVITESHMRNALRKMPPWLGRAVNALADRLRGSNELVHPLLACGAGLQVTKQLFLLLQYRGRASEAKQTARVGALDTLVAETGDSLGLPTERVLETIKLLGDENLLQITAADAAQLVAPDISRLERFVAYCDRRRPDVAECDWVEQAGQVDDDAAFARAFTALVKLR